MSKQFSRIKILWFLPPLVVGIAVLMIMKSGKQPPQLSSEGEQVKVVRTMLVKKADFVPKAKGYGLVQPAQVWKSIAQVSGRLISLHERLKDGEIIKKGEVLFQVDPVDYEINLAQAKTQLAELDLQLSNTRASLEIEQRNLALAEKEYKRQQKLAKKGGVSKSSADSAERSMLSSIAQVQNLKNTLSLIPTQKKLQQAKITQSQRDLNNTHIKAPFNLRVSALSVEADQFVSKGQLMFSGDSVDRVEVIAQVSLSALKKLFYGLPEMTNDIQFISTNLSQLTGFKPTVVLDMGNDEYAKWDATFVRFSDTVDSETRTMGVVVAVDRPIEKIIPGTRPPLSKGMFVEVIIAGHVQPNRIAIPRSAIRNGSVYVMNSENRLDIRKVRKIFDQQSVSVISEGINDGEQLVITDLIPVAQGMLLKAAKQINSNGS